MDNLSLETRRGRQSDRLTDRNEPTHCIDRIVVEIETSIQLGME